MKITKLRVKNWKSFVDSRDLELGDINVIVGRNSTGKSALLKAVHWMQDGVAADVEDIRIGEREAEIQITLESSDLPGDFKRYYGYGELPSSPAVLTMKVINQNGSLGYSRETNLTGTSWGPGAIAAKEPDNFIYTYLSKRKVVTFDRTVDIDRTLAVSTNLQHLVAKVDRLTSFGYEAATDYEKLCNDVLGFSIGTYPSKGGHQAGITIGRYDHIPIEAMGEGVSSQLGLIVDLCMADGNLFLIEELENDVHPESLKALLDVIIEKSANNQFIITTHSNVVTRHLGAARNCRLFAIESDFTPGAVPTSRVRPIDNTPEERIAVLRQLGYELYDFDLWEGWVILEESSAEVIIQRHLIPWFVPRLTAVRTLSAGGTSKVEPTFEDFRRMFLFAHLEPQYAGRAWVVVDGDESGKKVIESLKAKYGGWPADHFQTFTARDFEDYYPPRFAEKSAAALTLKGQPKRDAKNALLDEVKAWCLRDPDTAKREFEVSAAEVIGVLKGIDAKLFGG